MSEIQKQNNNESFKIKEILQNKKTKDTKKNITKGSNLNKKNINKNVINNDKNISNSNDKNILKNDKNILNNDKNTLNNDKNTLNNKVEMHKMENFEAVLDWKKIINQLKINNTVIKKEDNSELNNIEKSNLNNDILLNNSKIIKEDNSKIIKENNNISLKIDSINIKQTNDVISNNNLNKNSTLKDFINEKFYNKTSNNIIKVDLIKLAKERNNILKNNITNVNNTPNIVSNINNTFNKNNTSNINNVLNNTSNNEDLLKYNINKIDDCKDISWEDLNVSKKMADILKNQNFKFPTPVQAKSIPHILNGRDVVVRAKNGTGKTASFIIPICSQINLLEDSLQAIILVPIRELAFQVAKNFKKFTFSKKNSEKIKCMPIVGGTDLADDVLRISNGIHIIVGTPGRVLDVLNKNICKISKNIKIVFDEADKLLDSEFYNAISSILNAIPNSRQLSMFSATFHQRTEPFVNRYAINPLKIKISNDQNLLNVDQFYIKVENRNKILCLKNLLTNLNINQCIIYCNSISHVKLLANKITEFGISCYFMHSQMSQEERNTVYHNFAKNRYKILVSTDITTRGIDVPNINIVINYDFPNSSESYLHRVGRTGRFGTNGCAINMINEKEIIFMKEYSIALKVDLISISDIKFKEYCN